MKRFSIADIKFYKWHSHAYSLLRGDYFLELQDWI